MYIWVMSERPRREERREEREEREAGREGCALERG